MTLTPRYHDAKQKKKFTSDVHLNRKNVIDVAQTSNMTSVQVM